MTGDCISTDREKCKGKSRLPKAVTRRVCGHTVNQGSVKSQAVTPDKLNQRVNSKCGVYKEGKVKFAMKVKAGNHFLI